MASVPAPEPGYDSPTPTNAPTEMPPMPDDIYDPAPMGEPEAPEPPMQAIA